MCVQGGVDPRLWSAIVASYTYNLPTYTFDLSPWLPQLNTQPNPSPSSKGPTPGPSTGSDGSSSSSSANDASSDARKLPPTSRRLTQDAPSTRMQHRAAAGLGADMQLLSTGTPSHSDSEQQQQQQQQPHKQHQWASAADADSREAAHMITVELAGATGNGWLVANTLLLWRAVGADGQPQAVEGRQQVELETSPKFYAPLSSECEPLEGQTNMSDLSVAGECRLKIRNRCVGRFCSLAQTQDSRVPVVQRRVGVDGPTFAHLSSSRA